MAFVITFAFGRVAAPPQVQVPKCISYWATPAEAGQRSFVELSGGGAAVRAAIKLDGSKKLGSALDQERSELAERIQVDPLHMGGRGGDFKLLAQPFPWLGLSLGSASQPPCHMDRVGGVNHGSNLVLLTHQAYHCRAAVDHIEFARRRTAHIDNTAATIRPPIRDADDYSPAITHIGHQHLRAKRQCPMSSSKPGRAGYFPACGMPTAIECRQTAFSANRTDRDR